jgi:CHAT domain-containing protein/Tfp pilus assembly protein PilF
MSTVKRPILFAIGISLFWVVLYMIPAQASPPAQNEEPADPCFSRVALILDGQMDEALPLLETDFESTDDWEFCAFLLGRALNNTGFSYHQLGQFKEALAYYEEALKIRQEFGNRSGEGTTLNNMGEVLRNQGRYAEALNLAQAALAIRKEVEDLAGVGQTLNNIGLIYDAQGRHSEAQDHYQDALVIWLEMGDQREQGNTLGNIGYSLHLQGKYSEAQKYYKDALKLKQDTEDRMGEGITLNNMGETYRSQKQYDEALKVFKDALGIAKEVGDRVGEATSLNSIALVNDALDRHDEALDVYEEALALHLITGYLPGAVSTLFNIGDLYKELGEIQHAADYYEQGMELLESLRATSGSEQARSSFIDQYSFLYTRVVALYSQNERAEEAFFTSERARARAFLDSLATGHVQLADDDADGLLVAEQEAYTARRDARGALAQAKDEYPLNTELISVLEEDLLAAEQAHKDVLQAIEARNDQLATLLPGRSSVLALRETQQLLDDQTSLVSYYLLGEGGSLAFIVSQDDFFMVELPEATKENLQFAVEDLHKWINKENPHPLPLQNLHKWLVAPLLDRIHTPQVGIIPHQFLHYIPFTALSDGQSYLGERFLLFNLPSASAYRFIQENTPPASPTTGKSALVFGNPDVSERGLVPLQYAEHEANTVAGLFNTVTFIGGQASEGGFWAKANEVNVIHLAAHGSYDQVDPLLSSIHLAQDAEHDGLLEAHEIYGLDLSMTELVTLSACETNVGSLSSGDEVVGLTRAFFFAGSPSILSSLWKVDDAATAALMEAYYRNWLAGKSKAEALQAAQAELRERLPSPFFWAAFVLNGDPGLNSAIPEVENVSTEEKAIGENAPVEEEAPGEIEPAGRTPGTGLCSSAGAILVFGISLWWGKARKRSR